MIRHRVPFDQDDPPDYIYATISGEVEVVQSDPEHGDMAVFNNTLRNATIRALTPVEAMSIQQTEFTTLYTL